MTANGWLQIGAFALAVLLVTKPLGLYLVAVYEGRVRWLAPGGAAAATGRPASILPRSSTGRATPPGCCSSARRACC